MCSYSERDLLNNRLTDKGLLFCFPSLLITGKQNHRQPTCQTFMWCLVWSGCYRVNLPPRVKSLWLRPHCHMSRLPFFASFTPQSISRNIMTTCQIFSRFTVMTEPDLWRYVVLSGTEMLAGNPLRPGCSEVGPLRIRLFCLAHPTTAPLDWYLKNLETMSTP